MEEVITNWFLGLAFEPTKVYLTVVVMMLLSGFGLPIPEEVTLVSGGLLAYMGAHPEAYPPPYPGAPVVDPITLAVVSFGAVVFSDLLVFMIGRIFGARLRQSPRFNRIVKPQVFSKVEKWVGKYGVWMAAGFRFTPGVRFPGHIVCGMFGIPIWLFLLMDGMAALISVPTQILLIAHYGEVILGKIKDFKLILLAVAAVFLVFYVGRRLWRWWRSRSNTAPEI